MQLHMHLCFGSSLFFSYFGFSSVQFLQLKNKNDPLHNDAALQSQQKEKTTERM